MLSIYNTLTRQKEVFNPIVPNKVGIYVCGVTVYDYCHLGHARTYTSADVVVRYLKYRGYDVNYVRNITDIDDKIIKRANESGKQFSDVTAEFISKMHEDFAALGFLEPDSEPKATDYIPQMISLIEKIIANKHGYVASNGDVYFDVRSHANYGCLSHHNIDELESGARVDVADVKKDPLDFVLWKLAKPGEPSWQSPWGEGRPGWHIECSAMAAQLLGETFDIHAGGRDLIFPHHENEIAQSEAGNGKKFVNTWMHGGFVQIDKEKMSKSLNNFTTIRDVLADHDKEVLRYFLLASHYRSPLMYTPDALSVVKQSLDRFYNAMRGISGGVLPKDSKFEKDFQAAMDDDFNTPVALSVLFELSHEIQRTKATDQQQAADLVELLKHLGGVLGLLQRDPESYFQEDADIDVAKIEKLIADRNQARASKNWTEADRIRDELQVMSITIEDGAGGTTWRKG